MTVAIFLDWSDAANLVVCARPRGSTANPLGRNHTPPALATWTEYLDLLQILQTRIESLADGPHTPGLRAVLLHIQVAANHLARGTEIPDDSAFTDAVYRTNQAFEGSLKEAYRVLAEKEPDRVRPFDIEAFLQDESIIRGRVLEQLSRYRTGWRNPSTHDYKLDFDEDEALLAIVSVSAFAIVLIDQIAEKLCRDRARMLANPQSSIADRPLAEMAVEALLAFESNSIGTESGTRLREVELVGVLAGYLDALLPSATITTDTRLGANQPWHADILIEAKGERVLLEVKRLYAGRNTRAAGVTQLSQCLAASGIRDAILFLFSGAGVVKMKCEDTPLPGVESRIVVIEPDLTNPGSA